MIVLRQHRIYKQDIQANPDVLYVFGDNLDRQGYGGQAREMRGHKNSFGIATKRTISHSYPDDYFFDHEEDVIPIIDQEFSKLQTHIYNSQYKAIVIPLDGIGTGLSKMPQYAPKALEYINQKLQKLERML